MRRGWRGQRGGWGCRPTIVMPARRTGRQGRGDARVRRGDRLLRSSDRKPRERLPPKSRQTTRCGAGAELRRPLDRRGAGDRGARDRRAISGRHRPRRSRGSRCAAAVAGCRRASRWAPPHAAIVVVEPEGWDDMGESLRRGAIVPVGANPPVTSCDALQTLRVADRTFEILQRARRDRHRRSSEAEIAAAMRFAFETLKLVVEPGGAVDTGGGTGGQAAAGRAPCLVVSGGNVDPRDLPDADGMIAGSGFRRIRAQRRDARRRSRWRSPACGWWSRGRGSPARMAADARGGAGAGRQRADLGVALTPLPARSRGRGGFVLSLANGRAAIRRCLQHVLRLRSLSNGGSGALPKSISAACPDSRRPISSADPARWRRSGSRPGWCRDGW